MNSSTTTTTTTIAAAAFCLTLIGGSLPQRAGACTMCLEVPGRLWGMHAKSIEIAVAIRREIDAGAISKGANPASDKMPAVLLNFRMRKLINHQHRDLRSLELVLIENGARFRIDPSDPKSGFVPVKEGTAPSPPAVRWLTGRDVLHALLERRISFAAAVGRGVLLIETPDRRVTRSGSRDETLTNNSPSTKP